MAYTDISEIFAKGATLASGQVSVAGWVRTARDSKTMAFAALNDGTTLRHLQIVFDKSKFAADALSACLKSGAAIAVRGEVVPAFNEGGGFEINAEEVELLGDCPADYPLQKKYHTLEFLRTIPHLRVRTNTFNAMLRVRSKLSFALHRFFQERGYTYVHTPIITGSDCEGAGEIFRVTTNTYEDARACKDEAEYIARDFFCRKAGLTVSGQLEGEVAAMAMGKIYTFGPTFRAENSNTPRHAAEFWQIEPEVAFAKLPDIIKIAEEMIKFVIKAVLDECGEEMEFFERACCLTEKIVGKPVFVINYPKAIKSFYMKQNDDGKTVAATDLLVPGVGEIIGCSEREADLDKLTAAMVERGMNLDDYKGYMELRKYGTVPHSGFGLGLERILMYVTGIGNIRDLQLYSRTAGDLMA